MRKGTLLGFDDLIIEDEFNEIGWDYDFAAWDVDNNGYLDAGEVYDSYYSVYDEDEDGHWNLGEWDDADDEGWLDV